MRNILQLARYILKQVEDRFPESQPKLDEMYSINKLILDLPELDSDYDYERELRRYHLSIPDVDTGYQRARQVILSLNDAYMLIRVWYWLMDTAEPLGDDTRDFKYWSSPYTGSLSKAIRELIRAIDEHSAPAELSFDRELSNSVSFSYLGQRKHCLAYVKRILSGTYVTEESYNVVVNYRLKNELGLEPIFLEAKDD